CGFSYDTYAAADPDWLKNKKIRFLIQDAPKRIKELPDVPLVSSFVKDPKEKEALELLSVRNSVGRPYLFPPKVPEYLVSALRTAFDKTMKDPKFLAEAKRMRITPHPMSGAEVEAAIKKAYKATGEVVKIAAKLWPPAVSKGGDKKKKK
ncbi:MAG TPA: hypothetical protein VLN73_06340, partial [Alphaproteobacteria bacterium]|nr:hypothetical protein [Alphaproteobacteria bacterium]